MANDSLSIADGLFELMGGPGGVQSAIPELQNSAGRGAVFQVLAEANPGSAVGFSPTWSLGEPQPTIDLVQTLLLDGERPFGARASNRTITLPIKITAPDQVTLTAARELLLQTVDATTFTLTYTPASTGLSTVFDCFRALPTLYGWGFLPSQPQPICVLTLTFQALPYGRTESTALTQVPFASPLIGGVTAPPAPLVIDNFSSVAGTDWSQNSRTGTWVTGPNSAHYSPSFTRVASYAKAGLSANITGLTALSVWCGQAWDTTLWPIWRPFKSNVTMSWTLTDNNAHTISFHRTMKAVPWSDNQQLPKFTRITAPIPQGVSGFNYGTVTGYSVRITNTGGSGGPVWARLHLWLDALTANPPSLAIPASQRGTVYNIMGTSGTARTPVSTQFQLPQAQVTNLQLAGGTPTGTKPGPAYWWPPSGVTSVKVECFGGGGAGAPFSTAGLGGGGGGGEYAAETTLAVTPGTPIPYWVGNGGQSGAVAQVTNFTAPGSGTWTCPAGVTTIKVECWGGGATGLNSGGGGGGGEYAAEPALAVTPGHSYPFTVAHGGYPGIQSGVPHEGYPTSFAGNAVTVYANGGPAGGSSSTGRPGGSGSTNTVHFNGGAGGSSPSFSGGGGGGSAGPAQAGNSGGTGGGSNGPGGAGANAVTGGGAGGSGSGTSINPATPGQSPGGGGGGGNDANDHSQYGAAGGAGQIIITSVTGGGNPVSGSDTVFGSVNSTPVTVTAHGGISGAQNSATGAAGGTGSSNSVHFSGGAGGLGGGSAGGGGGGSGGSASTGNTGTAGASGGAGASAVAGGGRGAGGSTVAGTKGGDAPPPGGGGGGSNSSGAGGGGGAGGNGTIQLTYTNPVLPFDALIVHRPGAQSPPELNPIVPVASTSDPPTGIEYTVPSLTPGVNALFSGTYTVVLVNYLWSNPTASRNVTVTVTQYEYGGPGSTGAYSYQLSTTRTITPSQIVNGVTVPKDINNGICIMGELTLPVQDVDPSNTAGFFTVSITDSNTADRFLDILFLDTQGSTVLVNLLTRAYTNFYIDEPDAARDLGYVLGTVIDRPQAVSVMDSSIISGSPFYIQPGDNLFMVYSPLGTPSLGMSFANRWYLERLV